MASNLRGRLSKLESGKRGARKYITPVLFYDLSDPSDIQRQQLEQYARAWREGWRPESGQILAYYMPSNGRPHPGR